jgi:hypothetical protein
LIEFNFLPPGWQEFRLSKKIEEEKFFLRELRGASPGTGALGLGKNHFFLLKFIQTL